MRAGVAAATPAAAVAISAAPAAQTGTSNGRTYSVTTPTIDGATADRLGNWDARIDLLSGGDPAVVEAFNHAGRIAAQEQVDGAKAESNPGEQWRFESNDHVTFRSIASRRIDPRHPLLRCASHVVHQRCGDR